MQEGAPCGDDICEKLFGNELEAHEVTLSAYFIDRTEVTVGAYRRCVELGAASAPALRSAGRRGSIRPDYPVTLVTLERRDDVLPRSSAGAYPPRPSGNAPRAGRRAAGFPWGNVYNKRLANHGAFALDDTDDGDGFAELAPVGSFPAGRTPDGIDDMAGNAEEWVADALDDASAHYPNDQRGKPQGDG